MEVKAKFMYLSTIIEVLCRDDEDINKMYEKFVNELKDDSKPTHYIYYCNGNKLGNQGPIGKNKYLIGQRNKVISVQKKLRFVKCPDCVCNDCIVNLDNNKLTFYGCKYGHTSIKKFDDYIKVQRLENEDLKCSTVGCERNLQNYFKGFHKCFTCSNKSGEEGQENSGGGSQYYCKEHISKDHENHNHVNYDKKNYHCSKHMKPYIIYCFNDKIDLCEDCLNEHKECKDKGLIKEYNQMDPNIDRLKDSLNIMEQNIENLRNQIEIISNRLLKALRLFKRYHYIAKDIIGKYELFNEKLKDYKILKSLRNLKVTTIKMNNTLTDIVAEKNTSQRINLLFKVADSQIASSTKVEKIDYSKDNDDDWLEEISKNDKIKSPQQRTESQKSKKA